MEGNESLVVTIDVPWRDVENVPCIITSFTTQRDITNPKIVNGFPRLPYGVLNVTLPGRSQEVELPIAHKIDYANALFLFEERGVASDEIAIVLYYRTKGIRRLFGKTLPHLSFSVYSRPADDLASWLRERMVSAKPLVLMRGNNRVCLSLSAHEYERREAILRWAFTDTTLDPSTAAKAKEGLRSLRSNGLHEPLRRLSRTAKDRLYSGLAHCLRNQSDIVKAWALIKFQQVVEEGHTLNARELIFFTCELEGDWKSMVGGLLLKSVDMTKDMTTEERAYFDSPKSAIDEIVYGYIDSQTGGSDSDPRRSATPKK